MDTTDETKARRDIEAHHGQAWDTAQLQTDFYVEGFAAPCVVVTRKSDNVRGSLEFTRSPRLYFGFVADRPRR